MIFLLVRFVTFSKLGNLAESTIPEFNSHEMKCAMCGQAMFYSQENLVHVCLDESHGILCYFEPDSCWFAASEKTALELGNRGLKFHYIPKSVFENGGIGEAFKCDYSEDKKSK